SNSAPRKPASEQQGMRLYEDPIRRTRPAREDLPTLYLIAFRDHSIVQGLGYRVEDGICIICRCNMLNQISLELVDRETSQQLTATLLSQPFRADFKTVCHSS